MSPESADLPTIVATPFQVPSVDALATKAVSTHPLRILHSPQRWQHASCARQGAGGSGSQRGLAVVQCREPDAHPRSLDADADHPQSVIGGKAFQEFDEAGRMKPSAYYDRLVDVMEELMKFTLLRTNKCFGLTPADYHRPPFMSWAHT